MNKFGKKEGENKIKIIRGSKKTKKKEMNWEG
jgi:hypothetical protein